MQFTICATYCQLVCVVSVNFLPEAMMADFIDLCLHTWGSYYNRFGFYLEMNILHWAFCLGLFRNPSLRESLRVRAGNSILYCFKNITSASPQQTRVSQNKHRHHSYTHNQTQLCTNPTIRRIKKRIHTSVYGSSPPWIWSQVASPPPCLCLYSGLFWPNLFRA